MSDNMALETLLASAYGGKSSGGDGGGGGTTNYNALTSKPKINGVTLTGDKSTADLELFDNLTPEQMAQIKGEKGAKGDTGEKGEDGYSPSITVTDITGGHRVTVTDATGSQSFDVMDGQGDSGGDAKAFIAKYNVTTAQDIIAYIDSENEPFPPVVIKRGNDYYTCITAQKQADNKVIIRSFATLSGNYYVFTYTITNGSWSAASSGFQPLLLSGTNIKTINGESLLGSGNVVGYDDTALSARVAANETAIADRYTKAQTDAKIADELANFDHLDYEIVTELPTTGASGVRYLVKHSTDNQFEEYIYVNDAWHDIGSTSDVNLSNYYTKSETNAYVLSQVTPKAEVEINESSNAMDIVGGGRYASFNVNTDGDMEMMLAEPGTYLKTATVPSKTNVDNALAGKAQLVTTPSDDKVEVLQGSQGFGLRVESGGLVFDIGGSDVAELASKAYVNGKTLAASGWGVARAGIATVTFNNSKWSSSATVDVSEFGFSSGADYDVVAQPTTGGTATPWGNAIAFVNADKGASSFSVSAVTMEESLSGTVNVKYTIFAKGYGGTHFVDGTGLPTGGVMGQVLAKRSDTDGDVLWKNVNMDSTSVNKANLQGRMVGVYTDDIGGDTTKRFMVMNDSTNKEVVVSFRNAEAELNETAQLYHKDAVDMLLADKQDKPAYVVDKPEGSTPVSGNVVQVGSFTNTDGTEYGIYEFYYKTSALPAADATKTYSFSPLLDDYTIFDFIDQSGITSNGHVISSGRTDGSNRIIIQQFSKNNKNVMLRAYGDYTTQTALLRIKFIGTKNT